MKLPDKIHCFHEKINNIINPGESIVRKSFVINGTQLLCLSFISILKQNNY